MFLAVCFADSYILKKFAQLLGYDELERSMRYLKSIEKLRAQDELWKLICADLNLPFVRSTNT